MVGEQQDVFYYLTLLNENYTPPRDASRARRRESCAACICCVRCSPCSCEKQPRAQLLGSGAILREVLAAASLLEEDWGVNSRMSGASPRSRSCAAKGWRSSAGTAPTRLAKPRQVYFVFLAMPGGRRGPVIASTDYIRTFADQLIGAGGGGFLMFYAGDKTRLRHAMREKGLQEVRFRFDFEGTKVLAQN